MPTDPKYSVVATSDVLPPSEAYGLCPGKKVRPIGPAKNPNTMKSYISRKLPLETRITFLILALRSVPGGWLLVFMIPGSNRDELWGKLLNLRDSPFCQRRKGGAGFLWQCFCPCCRFQSNSRKMIRK